MSFQQPIDTLRNAIRVHQTAPQVKLIAVTKTLSLADTEQAIRDGLTDIGENRLQVAEPKIKVLAAKYPNVIWHFIGVLQKNKVKKVLELFSVIHSVDSWALLDTIDKQANKLNIRPTILLQVNVSGEGSKQGFNPESLTQEIKKINEYQNVIFAGYMTMAPFIQDERLLRSYFKTLKRVAQSGLEQGIPYQELSMGMSNDFRLALEEGATMIRVGTLLFQ